MSETVEILNFILGTSGVLMLFAAIALFIDIVFFGRKHFANLILKYGLLVASATLIGAVTMALVYSEKFGFIPCGLCWSMRIFVFSQAFIMTTAWLRKDTAIAIYGIVLSVPGIAIGLYQHYLQMGGGSFLPCPAAAGDCAKRILFEYGFMTFPLLGASMLLFLLAIYIYLYKAKV